MALSSTLYRLPSVNAIFEGHTLLQLSTTWMLLHTVLNIRYRGVNVTSHKSSAGKRPGYRSPRVIPQQARANRGLDFHG